jgi:hypothetical protein
MQGPEDQLNTAYYIENECSIPRACTDLSGLEIEGAGVAAPRATLINFR